jgi:hypothetical protein
MDRPAKTFFDYVAIPLRGPARLLLAALVVPLLLSFAFPLWQIRMTAPQYPKGLEMRIYSYRLDGGNDGHDLAEINNLNHYIGMRPITRDELRDLDWMPFALLAMALLALRAAVLGTVGTLVDLSMIAGFVSLVAFGRFAWTLWDFGHSLDPHAAVKVAPFTPAIVGVKQIANFTTRSWPQAGTALISLFTVGVWALTAWCLWTGRREAREAAGGPAHGPTALAPACAR